MRKIKNSKADLEGKRGIFFQFGIIIALSFLLLAFEWSSNSSPGNLNQKLIGLDMETEMIPITRQENIKPPEPVKYQKFNIVENTTKIENDPEIFLVEIDPNQKVNIPDITFVSEETEKVPTVAFAEKMPEFPGGLKGLQHYIATHVIYPQIAIDADIQGKVYVQFVVDEFGKVHNAKIIRSVDPIVDTEALKVVKYLPDWTPGMQGEQKVKVIFTVPIVFRLK